MSSQIFKVDKFIVPEAAKEIFLEKVRTTHEHLRSIPGFVRDFVLEQTSGAGRFNYVTLVEWTDQSALENAKAVIQKWHAEINFNPQELCEQLGIITDLGHYTLMK